MRPARPRLAFLSAAVAAVLAVVLPVTIASAQTVPAAGNGVGASHPQMILAVGPSRRVSAGEGRCGGFPQPGFVSGLCVAAEEAINTGDVSVYTSTNGVGDVNYVGITNNVERRAAEQFASKGIEIEPIPGLQNLSRADARAVEQVLIEENGGPGGGQLLNQINSIARSNPIYEQSIQMGCDILSAVGRSAPNVCG